MGLVPGGNVVAFVLSGKSNDQVADLRCRNDKRKLEEGQWDSFEQI